MKLIKKNLLLCIVFIYDQKNKTCDANIKSACKILKMQAWERRKQLNGKKRNTTVFNAIIRCTVG